MTSTSDSHPTGSDAWLAATSYWIPAHMPVSAWLGHAPFASWLVSELKPRSIVELGTHAGFSYFVFCEAVRRLGLKSEARALDTWQGDDHAGFYGEEIFESVSAINRDLYSHFSTLTRGLFDDALDLVDDGSVDLLHIDGRHGFEDVKHDFEAWLPKMSPQGVVLFHDIAEHQEGFGVWRFWDDVKQGLPSFSFLHSHGLGVLGVGDALSRPMKGFFQAAEQSPDLIRSTYEELGVQIERLSLVSHSAAREAQTAQREVETKHLLIARETALAACAAEADQARTRSEQMRAELDVAHRDLRLARENVTGLRQQLDAVHSSTSWRLTRPLRKITSTLRQ